MSEKNISGDLIESRLNLEVKEGIKEEIEYPKVDSNTLDEISDLAISDKYRKRPLLVLKKKLSKKGSVYEKERALTVFKSLAGRDIENELPIEVETFKYRRNIAECKKLKRAVSMLLDKGGRIDLESQEDTALLERASTLLALELRKADWLEKNYFPVVFARVLAAAKGEVMQFLIKQKNQAYLDRFKNLDDADILFLDELNYLLDKNPVDSAGVYYNGGKIKIRILDYYTEQDEWELFSVLIHELIHYVSQHNCRVGIETESGENEKLNEAITEILAFEIAREHLEKEKTSLSGVRERKLSLADRAYSEYTLIVKQIFSKIPLSFFKDAMLNEEGMQQLKNKFAEAFGKEDSLIEYGRKLENLYRTAVDRKK